MRVLFDTHALLWYHLGDARLSTTALSVMDDPINDRFVSVASLWEIGIKVSKGKLLLNEPFVDFVQHAVHDNGFSLLPINTAHIERLLSLPFHHKDPFDRILVAQALVENVPLVTCDKDILRYPITQVW